MTAVASFVEVTIDGYGYSHADIGDVSESFAPLGPVYATGGWAPSAIPPVNVDIVLTFVGSTIATLIVENTLERVWREIASAWNGYRAKRVLRSEHEPELCRLAMRADDFELVINGVLDPTTDGVLGVLELLAVRRSAGELRDFPIRRVTMPCIREGDRWEVLDRHMYVTAGDFEVWFIESRSAEPDSGFYDAGNDCWLAGG